MTAPAPRHVKITSPNFATGHQAEVEIDGVKQHDMTAIELHLAVGAMNTMVVHFAGPRVDFDGLARVVSVPSTLEDRVRTALERVKNLSGVLRVPAEPADPDLVLADVLHMLERARTVDAGAAKHGWLSARALDRIEGDPDPDLLTSSEILALIAEVRRARRDAAVSDDEASTR